MTARPLREQLARALAERVGSHAFRTSGRISDGHQAVWYDIADAALTARDEEVAQLRQLLESAEKRATRAEAALARIRPANAP